MLGAYERFRTKLGAAITYCMVYSLSGILPLYIVNEYPKSGGTWLAQMLGQALGIPFPRTNRFPMVRSSVIHSHYPKHRGMKNTIVIWRDGRDVMVSLYHHCFFLSKNEPTGSPFMEIIRNDLPFANYENIRENLPAFIEYFFTRQRYPSFTWAEFVRRWYGRKGITYVRYEDLNRDTPGQLRRVISELTGKNVGSEKVAKVTQELSFERLSGRRRGEENKNSFLRKGIVGDWRNYFNKEASECFDLHAGDELILLGYESDRSWVAGQQ